MQLTKLTLKLATITFKRVTLSTRQVDNLEDVGMLESCVKMSCTFTIFLSAKYFVSKNTQKELITALKEGKPIITVYEADEAKGGATIEQLMQEARANWPTNVAGDEHGYASLSKMLAHVFDNPKNEPIPWVRVKPV